MLRTHIEKPAALGGAEPFVIVAGIGICIDCGEIERELTDCMGAIDDGQNAGETGAAADFLNRKRERGGRGDVTQKDDFGARIYRAPELFDKIFGRRHRHQDRHLAIDRAALAAVELPGQIESAVFVVGRENFIAGFERKRFRDDIDAVGGVGDIDDIVTRNIQVLAEIGAGIRHQIGKASLNELDRLELHFALPALVFLEDRLRTRTKGPMIEKRYCWIEEKIIAQRTH